MRSSAPELLPIFRSAGQGQLLARVFLRPDQAGTISQLARDLNLDPGGISREADRLERAGLIESERIGNQRRLRANEASPFYPELRGLLIKAFGPVAFLGVDLANVPGITDAYIFGSWAARYVGEPGEAPNDVDLLVIGKPDRRKLLHVLRQFARKSGYEVNPTVISEVTWADSRSGFLKSVKRGHLIRLGLGDGPEGTSKASQRQEDPARRR